MTESSFSPIIKEIREAKCLVCNGVLRWCVDCKTYHHLGDTDHRDRRGFDPIGNPDESYYQRKWR